MKQHSQLSASGAKRWMNCPGSVRMEEGQPDSGSSYAREGTAAHELIETCLRDGVLDPIDFLGQDIGVPISGEVSEFIAVTPDMVDATTVFVNYVRDRIAANIGAIVHFERRGDLGVFNPPVPMFGTADVVIFHPERGHMEVIDYKHGQGVVVEVTRNEQTMYYALVASVAEGRVPDTIRCTIVQPRAQHDDGPIRSYDFDRDELVAFKHELMAAAERTQDPDAPLQVGPWCRFCRAKAICPAQKQHAVDLMQAEFEFEVAPQVPSPQSLTTEELGVILLRAPYVMDWLREVESYALAHVENGGHIPGFKLVEKRTNRRWKDEDAAERYLARRGLKKSERTKQSVVSPSQAEKLLKQKGLDTARLEKHWEKPEGAAKLVPEEDSRPQIKSSVESDFELLPPPAATS
jgi:hypothetical protein